MRNAVDQFRKRREERLGKPELSDIEKYRIRRQRRLDAKNNNSEDEEVKGSHGNTRLPYGLAKGEGIDTTGLKPREVWDLLSGEGYTLKSSFEGLKQGKKGKELKTGKKEDVSKPARAKVDVKSSAFEKHFTTPRLKSFADTFTKELNKSNMNPDIANLVNMLFDVDDMKYSAPFKVTLKGDSRGAEFGRKEYLTGKVYSVGLKVPNLKGLSGDELKRAVSVSLHEMMHAVDFALRDSKDIGGDFTDRYNASGLKEELNRTRKMSLDDLGSEVKELFAENRRDYDSKLAKANETYKQRRAEVDKAFGGKSIFDMSRSEYEQYETMRKAAFKELEVARSDAMLDASHATLGNLYDAITGGRLKDAHRVSAGHSASYFRKVNPLAEILSCYSELSFLGGSDYEAFRKDQPKIAMELDNMLSEMVSRGRGRIGK